MNISIIEDDKILASRIKKQLERDSFWVKLFTWFKDFIKNHTLKTNLYLIDLSLWDWDWFEIINFIRKEKKSDIPIIIVSAYNDEERKVYWLNLWADDYITKIFSTKELIARINAVLRRKTISNNKENLQYKNITFDIKANKIIKWKRFIYLTNKENRLVYLFMLNKWKMLSKTDLIDFVWWDYERVSVTDNTINCTLSKVRRKLWKNFKLVTKINQWYILEN